MIIIVFPVVTEENIQSYYFQTGLITYVNIVVGVLFIQHGKNTYKLKSYAKNLNCFEVDFF